MARSKKKKKLEKKVSVKRENSDTQERKYKPAVTKSLAEAGTTAKAYAAYFGTDWKKITDVYKIVYAGDAKNVNTGRISEVTQLLFVAGLLERKEREARWPVYRASLEWLFQDFAERNAALTPDEKTVLRKVLFPSSDQYKQISTSFQLSEEELKGTKSFISTPEKIRDFLHASVTLAVFMLGDPKSALPKPAVSHALLRIKRNLGMYEGKEPEIPQAQEEPAKKAGGEEEVEEGPYVESFASYLLLKYRTSLRDHIPPQHTLLSKMVRTLYDARTAELIWSQMQARA